MYIICTKCHQYNFVRYKETPYSAHCSLGSTSDSDEGKASFHFIPWKTGFHHFHLRCPCSISLRGLQLSRMVRVPDCVPVVTAEGCVRGTGMGHLKTKQLHQKWSRLGRNMIAAIKTSLWASLGFDDFFLPLKSLSFFSWPQDNLIKAQFLFWFILKFFLYCC